MQEEITEKSIALSIRAVKFSGSLLKTAIEKLLKQLQEQTGKPKIYHGKQTIKQLIKQNVGVTNIEVSDKHMKSFQRIAKKYGVDFAIKKDVSLSPPKYLVFFKARDTDAMTAAFQEFTAKTMNRTKKPSILQKLANMKELMKKNTVLDKAKNKQRER